VSEPPRWSVEVDAACIASGMCLGVADSYFVRGEDGRTRTINAEVDADDTVLDAAASCPVEAIVLHDIRTGKPIEP
jgi:ferredoxin